MYRLNDEQVKACHYFMGLDKFTDEQACNAVKFCCSICGCSRGEQDYLLNWYFDGIAGDLVTFGNKYNGFSHLLDFCGNAYVMAPDDEFYSETLEAMNDNGMIAGEILPSGNLFVYDI